MFYITDIGQEPREASWEDFVIWIKSLPEDIRTGMGYKLKRDEIGNICISTVYIGMNCGIGEELILWETAVFKDNEDDCFFQYTSEKEALKNHAFLLEKYTKEQV